MKVILSKKGLDSSNSIKPITINNKQMLFLPIPSDNNYDTERYSEIFIDKISLLYYCKEMGIDYGYIKEKEVPINGTTNCHLDPQLLDYFGYADFKGSDKFKGNFGQVLSAQKHLENSKVQVNDLFLFYGWYNDKNKPNGKHTIFGYLQIGEIIKVNELTPDQKQDIINKYPWLHHQPHWYSKETNNTIYIARETCTFDKKIKGYGMFKYNNKLDLTANDMTLKTCWKIPKLKNCKVSFKDKNGHSNFNELGQFRVADRCQELVIEECPQAEKWAINLIKKYAKR